jgi:LysM repeat protein
MKVRMWKHWKWSALCALLLLALTLPRMASASRAYEPTPAELIAAVNNLRLARGLPPLTVHPILMQVAQSQADALLATGGAVGHTRPNGITLTQQLLMLGYPLSGDLSLGGYRSENFVFGYSLTPQDAIQAWLGDEPHTTTMLSPNHNDIGAGVAIASDGTVYYVIDAALRTDSGLPQSDASQYLPGSGTTALNPEDALNQYIVPITVSTARPDGDVFHKVQYGQSLWAIAIEYHTKIDQIRLLNNLRPDDNTVYPNQLLLVMKGATQPAPSAPTVITAVPVIGTLPVPTMTMVPASPTATLSVEANSAPTDSSSGPSLGVMILILALLIVVGGGTAVWFIREPPQETKS